MKQTPESLGEQLISLIENNEIDKVCEYLQEFLRGNDLKNSVILQCSRWKEVTKKEHKNILFFNEIGIEKNKVKDALLDVIKECEPGIYNSPPYALSNYHDLIDSSKTKSISIFSKKRIFLIIIPISFALVISFLLFIKYGFPIIQPSDAEFIKIEIEKFDSELSMTAPKVPEQNKYFDAMVELTLDFDNNIKKKKNVLSKIEFEKSMLRYYKKLKFINENINK